MSNANEGAPAPDSLEAKALAELEKEGHVVEGKEPPETKEEPKAPTPPKEEVKEEEPAKEEPKPERTPQMVETWKLRVAEEQKAALQAKLDELTKQKDPVNKTQAIAITEDVEAIIKEAEANGTDGTFLRKLAASIISKAQPPAEIVQTLESLKKERELEKQLNVYQAEFEKDVLPLVKEYNLPDTALLKLRQTLKDYAFSETYAKVPLREIFKIKEGELDLKAPKRSSESKGVKARASDVVDLNNLDEEAFGKLTPAQIEQFVDVKTASVWKRNKK